MSNTYKLQLRSHKEFFQTREEAVEYINSYFAPEALVAEPTLYFYGEASKPKSILAFGAGNRKVAIMDTDSIMVALEEVKTQIGDAIEVKDDMASLLNALGLTKDSNLIRDKITYKPSRRNELLEDATSVSDALEILSNAIQSVTKTTFVDSNTVVVGTKVNPYTQKTDNVFNVKISGDGTTDVLTFNNNIVGAKSDGVFASVDLNYNESTNELIFTSSGVDANGRFMDDAKRKRFKLSGGSGASTSKTVTHREEPLSNVIDNINRDIDSVKRTIAGNALQGGITETSTVRVVEDTNGGKTVFNDVKLSRDESIVINQGGLSADVDAFVDNLKNELVLRVGKNESRIPLPGVSIVKSVSYNPNNRSITVELVNGSSPLVIPVNDLLTTWKVENEPGSMVVLRKQTPREAGQTEILTADIKLGTGNNLLGYANGGLYLGKEAVIDPIMGEIETLYTSIHRNADLINEVIATNRIQDETITNVRERLAEIGTKVDGYNEHFNAIREGVEDAENHYQRLNDTISTLSGKVLATEGLVNGHTSDIAEVKSSIETLRNDVVTKNEEFVRVTSRNTDALTRVDSRFGEVNSNLRENNTKLDQLNLKSSLIEAKVNGLEEINRVVNTIKDRTIPAINAKTGDIENSVEELGRRLIEAERNIDTVPVNVVANNITENASVLDVTRRDNVFTISSDVKVSSMPDNIIKKVDGHLFASAKASEHKGVWSGTEKSVQDILSEISDKLREQDGKIAEASRPVTVTQPTTIREEANVEIRRDGDTYKLYKNNQPVAGSEFTIPSRSVDTSLVSGEYEAASQSLKLTVSDGGTNTRVVTVPISDVVAPSITAGKSMELSQNKFSVRIHADSATILTSTDDGLKINLSEYAKTTEVDRKIGEAETRVKGEIPAIVERVVAADNGSAITNKIKAQLDPVKEQVAEIAKKIPTNASETNKLVSHSDLTNAISGLAPSGSVPTVTRSNGAVAGTIVGDSTDTGDVLTVNGVVSIKVASGIDSESKLEDGVTGNLIRTSKTGGLFVSNVFDAGQY